MPHYTAPAFRTPFGQNEYLRSTRNRFYESGMCAKSAVPVETIDDSTDEKVLQPGTVMAFITAAGADQGKVGPYEPGGVVTESVSIPVDATGGTWTITIQGETTAAIAFNATAAAVQAAVDLLPGINPGDIIASGGPGNAGGTTPYVLSWNPLGPYAGVDAPPITTGAGSLTGGAGTATPTTTAGGMSSGATDGRGDPANIAGINDTFLPWQLKERDVEVALLQSGDVVQSRCFQLGASGERVAMSDETVAAIRNNPLFKIGFH